MKQGLIAADSIVLRLPSNLPELPTNELHRSLTCSIGPTTCGFDQAPLLLVQIIHVHTTLPDVFAHTKRVRIAIYDASAPVFRPPFFDPVRKLRPDDARHVGAIGATIITGRDTFFAR